MYAKINLYLLSAVLLIVGIGLTLYKHLELGFPLLPDEEQSVWTIEAQIDFRARGEPVIVSFTLPNAPPNMVILDEDFASSNYGFSEQATPLERRVQWSKRDPDGVQRVYYRMQVYEKSGANMDLRSDIPVPPISPEFDEPFRTASLTLNEDVRARSANAETFTAELLKELNAAVPSQNVRLLLGENTSQDFLANLAVELLALEGISSRIVRGLYLEDGRRRQALTNFLEIHNGNHWVLFDQRTAVIGVPENFLIWQRGGQSLLDVVGGRNSRVAFSIIENTRASRDLALRFGEDKQTALMDFSIYSLPIAEQNAFKSILLVPIGALIVVIMRLIVGLRTSGTFMPILIALALIQTTLVAGLIIFLLVVGTGLVFRAYLSRLNLLLVARISAVIIVVIGIMAGISILSIKLGISQALTVTFFPMIILAWTIERMSILWEEEGAKEVMAQGGGSLLVAVIAYLFMTNPTVEYLTFNFPELLFVLLAIILILGQYTGYRITELRRFQPMTEEDVSSKPK